MADGPRNDTLDSPQLLYNWTEFKEARNVTSVNSTQIIHTSQNSTYSVGLAIGSVTIIICLCGMVGNGIVIWLLGFHMKRNLFGVYLLNLAVADFISLLTTFLETILMLTNCTTNCSANLFMFIYTFNLSSYSAGLLLLTAISVESCISVLWPIWYKYHHPAHLSTIVCAVIWVLCFGCSLVNIVCEIFLVINLTVMWELFEACSIPIFPVLIVSSMILLIQLRSFSRRRHPSKLYITILINVLVFTLLTVPRGIYAACTFLKPYNFDIFFIMVLLSVVNSTVNPIIYFFVGKYREQGGRKPLQKVLQRALMDEDEEVEERRKALSPDKASHPLSIGSVCSAESLRMSFQHDNTSG